MPGPGLDGGDVSPSRPWPASARLLHRGDFLRVYNTGSRYSNPFFAAFAVKNDATVSRIGFTTPRALGKANVRNRIRRRVREAIRLHYPELSPGWDLVLNPRRAVLDADFKDIEREVSRLFGKLAREGGPAAGQQ